MTTKPHIRIHNEIFDEIMMRWPFSVATFKVLGYIIRWSWGWKKSKWTKEPFNMAEIARETCQHRTAAWRAFRELVDFEIVEIREDRRLRINKIRLAESSYLATGVMPKILDEALQNSYVAKLLRSRTATLTVAKWLRNSSRIATVPLQNCYGPYLEVDVPQQELKPYKQLHTVHTIQTERKNSPKKEKRTRKPNVTEKRFLDGFKNKYKERHRKIAGKHAIALAGLIKEFGHDKVHEKIDNWWEADLNIKGNRTVGAFIACFDSIGHKQTEEEYTAEMKKRAGID